MVVLIISHEKKGTLNAPFRIFFFISFFMCFDASNFNDKRNKKNKK